MKSNHKLLIALLLLTPLVQAHEPRGLTACNKESDDAQRLYCFDQAMASTSPAPLTKKTAPQTVAVNSSTPVDEFGMDDELKRRLEKDNPKDRLEELTAIVSKVNRRPHGELVMTLDNQQVWAEKKPSSYFPLTPGDSVTIKSGVLGSFRLVGPTGRTTRVSRIK